MTCEKSKFLLVKENKSGSVTFGNDAPQKIRGKVLVSLINGRIKSQDVLFVDGLKHNLLVSVRYVTEDVKSLSLLRIVK
jgi:hypothetical protein